MNNNADKPDSRSKLSSLFSVLEKQFSQDDTLFHSSSVEHLKGYDDILSYLASRGEAHYHYKHYVTRARALSILENNAIFLTDGSKWNDTFDREHFNPKFLTTKRFGTCFSASSEESIAMWMLYGGTDGNGAMIDFDRQTLTSAMQRESFECGTINDLGEFTVITTLPASKVQLDLVDILYFKTGKTNKVEIGRSSLKGGLYKLSTDIFPSIKQLVKHRSWSYENEVRLVATISKLDLEGNASRIKCIKIPLDLDRMFIENRFFDSPVSDDGGCFRESELSGTVEWNLCSSCHKIDNP